LALDLQHLPFLWAEVKSIRQQWRQLKRELGRGTR